MDPEKLCFYSDSTAITAINSVFFFFFLAACRLSLVAASGGYSSLRCAGFSLQSLLLLRSTGSRCVGFSSCGVWAQ